MNNDVVTTTPSGLNWSHGNEAIDPKLISSVTSMMINS